MNEALLENVIFRTEQRLAKLESWQKIETGALLFLIVTNPTVINACAAIVNACIHVLTGG